MPGGSLIVIVREFMRSIHPSMRIAAIILPLALAGCGHKDSTANGQGGMPPPVVSVVTVAPHSLTLTTELPGRLEASRVAQVRARAAGIVQKRLFKEGGSVKAGQVLFHIDPAPFQAVYASTQAAVAKSEANLAQAELKVKRYQPLVETNAISKQEFDDALTAQKQAVADLATSKATRQTAALNLGYATVTAPISGVIGRAQVTEGALVGVGEATPLATIRQINPIYVDLTQSGAEVLKMRRALAAGHLASVGKDQAKITLVTDDGVTYSHPGKLLFSDLSVDETSGAITLRAEFPNPDGMLMPGMYVRAQLDQAVDEKAITVPQQAVIRNLEGASVMVVGADGKVASQPVTADTAQGNEWIISKGLKAGDRVIVEGLQKVQPGATVNPEPWKKATPAAASAPAPQAKPTSKTK